MSPLICAFVLGYHHLSNGDIWWGLAEGRQILEHHHLPTTNTFSYTYPDQGWTSTQWLFSVLAYLVWSLGGIPGLILTRIGLMIAMVVLLLEFCRDQRVPLSYAVIGTVLFLATSLFRFTFRAHLMSITFFVWTLFLYHRNRSPSLKRTLVVYSPLFFLWSNLHSGVVFGLAYLFLQAGLRVLDLLRSRGATSPALPRQFFPPLAALAGTLMNFNGLQVFLHPTRHLSLDRVILINEYMPPTFFGTQMMFFWITTALFLGGTAVLFRRTKWETAEALPALVFLLLALHYNRIVPYFTLAALVYLLPRIPRHHPFTAFRHTWLLHTILAYLIILAPLFFFGKTSLLEDVPQFGFGVNQFTLPVGAVQFLEQHPVPDPIFNHFFWGGYLLWRLYPRNAPFIDGRIPAYPPEFVHTYSLMNTQPQVFYRADSLYHFNALILDHGTFQWDTADSLDARHWGLVYWDQFGHRIFVRRTEANRAYLEQFEFRLYKQFFSLMKATRLLTSSDSTTFRTEIIRHNHWAKNPWDSFMIDLLDLQEPLP
ncbi:MAG: hypothetical protein D6762_03415 [Candidatus Neomarinimicrobiota bacterium]|nr:MAG: hypothetical protein D6762_03415 [Candidatus Neomarinimicrobiota bacterium]